MTGPSIEFSFRLPICLHLDSSRIFIVPRGGIEIRTEEIIEEHDSRFGTGRGIEVLSDIDGAFRFTRLFVCVPDRNPRLPIHNAQAVYKTEVLGAINQFLDSYRYLTKRSGISNINDLKSVRDLHIERPGQGGVFTISFGNARGIGQHQAPRAEVEHVQLQDLLNGPLLPLEELFFMDAERYAVQGYPLQALVSAVIAIEIVARSKPARKPNWLVRILIPFSGLKLLLRKELSDRDMDPREIGNVIGAVNERNKIIHAGLRTTSPVDVYLQSIRHAIDLLKSPT